MDCRFKRYHVSDGNINWLGSFLVRIAVPIIVALIHRLLDHSDWSKYNDRRFNPLSFYSFQIHL